MPMPGASPRTWSRWFRASPRVAPEPLPAIDWSRQPFARGSYAGYTVGQYARIAGWEGRQAGNCHFCGEHTSLRFQGYMEGAAASGVLVGNRLAASRPL